MRRPVWLLVSALSLVHSHWLAPAVVLATAAATASAFYKVDALAGKLMLPYLAWLAFANALNLSVLQKNPQVVHAARYLGFRV